MAADQDWRLRVDINDPSALHERLRSARHFERELDPLIADDVVLSHDDDTVFAYTNTSASIEEVRRAIEHQLAQDGLTAEVGVAHWDDPSATWLAPGEAPPAPPPADDTIVTRTFVETAGKLVRKYFEEVISADARERGVKLSIVEHRHLLTTQIAFTLTGPASEVESLIADIQADASSITRFESASLTPI